MYERDGVVHLRGLLPREEVLNVRRRFFEYVQHTGVLRDGTAPVDGVYSGVFGAPDGEDPLAEYRTGANYERFVRDFVGHPLIADMAARIKCDWKQPWAFRQQVLRTNLPGSRRTATRVHYDQMWVANTRRAD